MLTLLRVENFILIDEAEIEFDKGLNVITGETGAGKSVVIGALNLALGAKANKDMIRNGAEKGIIQAVFILDDSMKHFIEANFDIPFEDDQLIIVRTLNQSGRSSIRINGIVTPLSTLKELSNGLVDIHGQHEHQSLLNAKKHLELLDLYGLNELGDLLKTVKDISVYIHKMDSDIKQISGNELEMNRNIERLKYEINEIGKANLIIDEDNDLEERFRTIKNVEEVKLKLNQVNQLLDSQEFDSRGILSGLRDAIRLLANFEDLNSELKHFGSEMNKVFYDLEDLNGQIETYKESVYFEETEFLEIQNRLDLINNLKRKYGHTIIEILEYYNKIVNELDSAEKSLELQKKYHIERAKEIEKYNIKALELSEKRKKIAKRFEIEIKEELKELNFNSSTFVVEFNKKGKEGSDVFNDGIDDVEYMISLNPGESPKSLKRVASGGELSRIMLAIKIIFARVDEVPLLVFDEIDSGISGRTAVKVGEKITFVSKYHQVICISHLPQIAVMADKHLLIEKTSLNNITTTTIQSLSEERQVGEISRLTSVHEVTDKTLEHAKEMIEIANEKKKKIKKM